MTLRQNSGTGVRRAAVSRCRAAAAVRPAATTAGPTAQGTPQPGERAERWGVAPATAART
eukprot:15446538-Alexandrium_andersonii.AAC.1